MTNPASAVLDIEQGVARLMGNSRIYFNALKRFASQADAARGVAAQLAAGDHAGAHLTVHTLKGSAGLLGAGEVLALATQVEAALARGDAVRGLLDELGLALQRVQARIDAVARDAAVAAPAAPEPVDTSALLDRLAALFDEGNGAAVDLLEKWGTVLEKELGAQAWKPVAVAAYDYDFERALAALELARNAGGETPGDTTETSAGP